MKFSRSLYLAAGLFAVAPLTSQGAATITIVNGDPVNVGFNDPTVVAPVGGNMGTTLGQQRLIAFQAAAAKWEATLTSTVPIRVLATWEALTCTATSAVLGSAGATQIFRDFPGAPIAGAWYSKALANKIIGTDQDPTSADLRARFNINLGNAGCLTGTPFYLGLDNNHGAAVDLVAVLTHEFGHGLGFQTFTSGSTGNFQSSFPSAWDFFLFDPITGLTWNAMTPAQRVTSAVSGRLAWNGANVTSALPGVLAAGTPLLSVNPPTGGTMTFAVGTASFGPALAAPGVTAQLYPVVDTAGGIGLACTALTPTTAAAVAGKIAVVDRGTCGFVVKVKACQDAGAVGVIVVDNAPGSPPAGLGGTDPTITIPSVRITQGDGAALKAMLAGRSRGTTGITATLGVNLAIRAGADSAGRMLMYSPSPFQGGSSVSHYDVSASPNQLMEPAINGDLTREVTPPNDLTFSLFRDIGW